MNPYRKIIQGFMLTKGTFGKLKVGVSVCVVNQLIDRVLVFTGLRVNNSSKTAVDWQSARAVLGGCGVVRYYYVSHINFFKERNKNELST